MIVKEMQAEQPRTVLVVDDDDLLRLSICDALEDEGYHTLGASDGQEALTILRSHAAEPDVIVLDLMMPTMNGWQFLDVRAGDPSLTAIPVVVLTAMGNRARANVESSPVLLKPVRLEDLLAVLAKSTRNGHAHRSQA